MAAHASVTTDPAIDRWNVMREDVYKHFKWTRRTARAGLIGMVFIPILTYSAFSLTDAKVDWTGKRKGESLSVRK